MVETLPTCFLRKGKKYTSDCFKLMEKSNTSEILKILNTAILLTNVL